MNPFRTERDAKEFLIGRIVAEAERTGAPLSEIERKMLYFSETGWTLPDMLEVNAVFDREYDMNLYEEKIAGLVRSICARENRSEQDREDWDDAVVRLGGGDHYLLVLIDGAESLPDRESSFPSRLRNWFPTWDPRARRAPGDRLRLWLVVLAVLTVIAAITMIRQASR